MFPWLPDGAIVAGEDAALEGDHETAIGYVCDAARRGLPVFAVGFSLLAARLREYASAPETAVGANGALVAEAGQHLERLLQVMPFADFARVSFAFRGGRVDDPAGSQAPFTEADDDWKELYRMLRIEMLPARNGDALWIEYGDAQSPRRVIIDGGTEGSFEDGLRARIAALPEDERNFELLVVTHVDSDHIAGVLELIRDDALGAKFGDIWFNAWRHLPGVLEGLGPVEGELLTQAIAGARASVERGVRRGGGRRPGRGRASARRARRRARGRRSSARGSSSWRS